MLTTESPPPLVLSRANAARALDVSIDHIDGLLANGELERVQLGPRKIGVKYASILRLIEEGVQGRAK